MEGGWRKGEGVREEEGGEGRSGERSREVGGEEKGWEKGV